MNINSETPAALEAILFACGAPVPFERLCEILGVNSEGLREAAAILKNKYSDDRENGIQLITVEGAYQLCTKAYVAEYVKKALELRKAPPLSKAALEVLAIIAYNQPVTRSFIEMVRGVDSSAIVASLTDKGLVCEKGTLDAPGRPVLFGTTDAFLRCFGLESIEDLPKTELQIAGEQVALDFSGEPENNNEEEKGNNNEQQ
ncbi:MAG: SMC-Scp complex subunit ScpB [Clostridia bacterium]|nr:SMC-Scp complex subunit ScpB [Clostridia bacterium]